MFGLIPLAILVNVTIFASFILSQHFGVNLVFASVGGIIVGLISLQLYWYTLKLLGALLDRHDNLKRE